MAKAIALHGLGLYIFAGEDLPEPDALNSKQRAEILAIVKKVGNKAMENDIVLKMNNLQINNSNFDACKVKINEMISENKSKEKK